MEEKLNGVYLQIALITTKIDVVILFIFDKETGLFDTVLKLHSETDTAK